MVKFTKMVCPGGQLRIRGSTFQASQKEMNPVSLNNLKDFPSYPRGSKTQVTNDANFNLLLNKKLINAPGYQMVIAGS